MRKAGDKWQVKVRSVDSGATRTEAFDGVVVCSGAHHNASFPKWPGFDEQPVGHWAGFVRQNSGRASHGTLLSPAALAS